MQTVKWTFEYCLNYTHGNLMVIITIVIRSAPTQGDRRVGRWWWWRRVGCWWCRRVGRWWWRTPRLLASLREAAGCWLQTPLPLRPVLLGLWRHRTRPLPRTGRPPRRQPTPRPRGLVPRAETPPRGTAVGQAERRQDQRTSFRTQEQGTHLMEHALCFSHRFLEMQRRARHIP